jgi:hypothetical protein
MLLMRVQHSTIRGHHIHVPMHTSTYRAFGFGHFGGRDGHIGATLSQILDIDGTREIRT